MLSKHHIKQLEAEMDFSFNFFCILYMVFDVVT